MLVRSYDQVSGEDMRRLFTHVGHAFCSSFLPCSPAPIHAMRTAVKICMDVVVASPDWSRTIFYIDRAILCIDCAGGRLYCA